MTENNVPAAVPAMVSRASALGTLTKKQERFAQRLAASGNATESYRQTYRRLGSSAVALRQRAFVLAHTLAVAARVRQLLADAAGDATIAARARMARLQAIVEADPAELVRIVAEPCKDCWPAATASGAPSPSHDSGSNGAPLHGLQDAPRADCPSCRGHGARRVVVAPTDELSPAARMLLKGVRQKSTGEIEIRMHDQLAASDQLNRMQGAYAPDRSVGLTAHVNVDFARMSREEQLNFLESLKPVAP